MTVAHRTFVGSGSAEQGRKLSEAGLSALNDPWPAFDEVWEAARPDAGHRFVSIRFYHRKQELHRDEGGAELLLLGERLL